MHRPTPAWSADAATCVLLTAHVAPVLVHLKFLLFLTFTTVHPAWPGVEAGERADISMGKAFFTAWQTWEKLVFVGAPMA